MLYIIRSLSVSDYWTLSYWQNSTTRALHRFINGVNRTLLSAESGEFKFWKVISSTVFWVWLYI